jgi:hypothetical protein
MADEQPKRASRQSPEPPKKVFHPPRLTVYGDIASLTRSVGRTGLNDGGRGTRKKTRP